MSGDDKQPEYAAEHQEAAQQNGTLDAVMNVTKVLPFGFGSGQGFHFGKTSFEGYDLNAMIDIVESANPELIEGAGNALVAARDAFNKAAEELSTNLGDIDWEGEAHTAFSTWGTDLVTTAYALATYADTVGTQVMAASSGLASVRKSMPPRDGRIDPKTVDEIPTPKRVEGNEEYTAAVKAESHRQEAINQMYRLASFYTVSGGMMQTAEEPVFPKMPDVGVPEPAPGYGHEGVGKTTTPASLSKVSNSQSTQHSTVESGTTRPGPTDRSSHPSVDDNVLPPKEHIGTEIDSVGTLPPQDTTKPTPVTPPTTTTGGPPIGTNPPIGPVGTPPVARGQAGRTTGFGGGRGPVSAQGRTGGPQSGPAAGRTGTGPMGRGGMPGQAAGRTGGPMGRGGMPGQAAGRTGGPMGRGGMPGQAAGRTGGPMGRGVVGGTPKPGGPVGKQPGGAPRGPVNGTSAMNTGRNGTGRPGVVGGKPVGGTTPGAKGPKVPRGTVIGREGTQSSRATGERPGQRGVIGANTSQTNAGQTPRRPVGSPEGVAGTPKGGAGAPRGRGGKQGSGETRSRREERRDGTSATD